MKPLLLMAPGLVLALHAQSALPGALTAHLKDAACVHLDFTQTRTLAALSRPLQADGTLVLARDQGVIWTLRHPLAITYVMGPKGLMVLNGATREHRTAQDAPMVAQMGRVFQALAQGDWQALESYFRVSGEGRPEHWAVTLLAKPPTAAFVKRIRLDGGRCIDRIRIEEAAGDRMDLVFQHQRLDLPLTEAETRLLAQD